jgi:hypothetical protein
VVAYRGFTSFLLGHLLLEVSSLGADVGPLDVIDPSTGDPDLVEYPTVRRLSGALSENHAATEFEEALESLLDGCSSSDPGGHPGTSRPDPRRD